MELEGRVAVVTGASTGIGRAIGLALAKAGCRLAVCARTERTLLETAEQLRRSGSDVLALAADVSKEEDVERFASAVRAELGDPEILVNNAGIGVFGPLLEQSVEIFDDTFGVNVRGVFLCSRAFVPAMVEAGSGVVVNVASLSGKYPRPGGAIYAGSKHAVMGMSASMMLELREHNVRVITLCPGSVDTPFFDQHKDLMPNRSDFLDPADVAGLVETAIRLSDRGTVSEVEIRPVNP